MTRRELFRLFSLAPLAPAIAQELLWKPGTKLISIPSIRATNTLIHPEVFSKQMLDILQRQLVFARLVNTEHLRMSRSAARVAAPAQSKPLVAAQARLDDGGRYGAETSSGRYRSAAVPSSTKGKAICDLIQVI